MSASIVSKISRGTNRCSTTIPSMQNKGKFEHETSGRFRVTGKFRISLFFLRYSLPTFQEVLALTKANVKSPFPTLSASGSSENIEKLRVKSLHRTVHWRQVKRTDYHTSTDVQQKHYGSEKKEEERNPTEEANLKRCIIFSQ